MYGCSSDVPSAESEFNYSVDMDSTVNEELQVDTIDTLNNLRTSENPNAAFLEFYKKFTTSISRKNEDEFNGCINANLGLYTIESAGAVPLVIKIYDIKDFTSYHHPDATFFEMQFKGISKEPVFEGLPKVICDDEVYDKLGCFAGESDRLKKSRIWNFYSLNEKEIQAIESLVETVEMTVINTSNYAFHFSLIDENWYLTFIDIRIPCTA